MNSNDSHGSEARSQRQLELLESMTIQMDGRWLKGALGNYEFFALVFQEGSKYGINKGRVSKLSVRRKQQGFTGVSRYVINFDRGWDIEPQDEETRLILDTLVEYFENLPLEKIP